MRNMNIKLKYDALTEVDLYNNIWWNTPHKTISKRLGLANNEALKNEIYYYTMGKYHIKINNEWVFISSNLIAIKYHNWFITTFPTLYRLWMTTDVKKTESEIINTICS